MRIGTFTFARGVAELRDRSMTWHAGAVSRIIGSKQIDVPQIDHIVIYDGFFGRVTFSLEPGMVMFRARRDPALTAIEAAGFELDRRPTFPNITVAVPPGRGVVWTPSGPSSEALDST